MVLAGAVLYFTLNVSIDKRPPRTPERKTIDYTGTISLFVAVAAPLFAINIGGNILPWNHYVVILLLAITPLLFGFLYTVESRFATNPIMPVRLVRIPAAIAVIACAVPVVFAFNQVRFSTLHCFLLVCMLIRPNRLSINSLSMWRLAPSMKSRGLAIGPLPSYFLEDQLAPCLPGGSSNTFKDISFCCKRIWEYHSCYFSFTLKD